MLRDLLDGRGRFGQPHMVVALAAVLFLAVFALGISAKGAEEAISALYVLPVGLVAMRLGSRAGILAATLGFGLFLPWAAIEGTEVGAVGYASRFITLFLLAALLGRAAEQHKSSETRFRTSLENMLDPFVILTAVRDAQGIIVDFAYEFANEAACRHNQVPRDALVGRRLLDLLPEHAAAGLLDEYRRVVETGEPLVRDNLVYTDSWGGRTMTRIFDVRATRLGDGLAYTWRDVTDRKRAELELREKEHQLRQAQELAHLGRWEWDLRTDAVEGAEELFRLHGVDSGRRPVTLTEALGFIHVDDLPDVVEALEHARDTAQGFEVEFRIMRPDGRQRWLRARGNVETDESGTPMRMMGIAQDITGQREAEEVRIRLDEAEMLHAQAVEINDTIVQGLAVAQWAMDLGEAKLAHDTVSKTLDTAQALVTRLLTEGPLEPGDLIRSRPALLEHRSEGGKERRRG